MGKHRNSCSRFCEADLKEYFRDSGHGSDGRYSNLISKRPWTFGGSSEPLAGELSSEALRAADKNVYIEALLSQQEDTAFVTLLRTCAKKKDLYRGITLHADVLKSGFLETSPYVADALVFMYAKCGALAKALELLIELPIQDVFSWTQVITGYVQKGQGQDALYCFEKMQQKGICPDAVTFTCVLKACGCTGAVEKGEEVHNEISRQGLLRNNVVLGSALVNMYAKCGALAKAQKVLDELPARDTITWSALIDGYAQQGQGEEALKCFHQMQGDGLLPDTVTFLCVLKACGSIGATDMGEQIHDEIVRQGLLSNNMVLGTALVDMYTKCGALGKAQAVLDELPVRDVVSWSALITGYAQQGQGQDALKCFDRMRREGVNPNAITYTSILKACGSVGAADKGEQIHHEIARQGLLKNNIVLGTALVDMYAKCGTLSKAQEVLEELPVGDVVSWSVLISGYAQQGCGEEALSCFERMQQKGFLPDAITISCILNACKQSGLVEEAQKFFADMMEKFGFKPNVDHFTCIVDLLGNTGHVDKAAAIIQRMPSSSKSAIWSVLMDSCLKWGDVRIGRWAFDQAVQADRTDVAPYLCMASIYAAAGMQEQAEIIKSMRLQNKIVEADFCKASGVSIES